MNGYDGANSAPGCQVHSLQFFETKLSDLMTCLLCLRIEVFFGVYITVRNAENTEDGFY